MTDLVLQKGRDWSVLHHHPWIFSGAIARLDGAEPAPGETVRVVDSTGAFLAWGAYAPSSQIRARLFSFAAAEPDAAFVESRVAAAVGRRADFWVRGETNAFRLVHAESDGLPGVVVDCYDGWTVMQLSTCFGEAWRATIAAALMKYVPGCRGVYERSDVDSRAREGLPPRTGVVLGEEPPPRIEIHEGETKFLVDVRKGHKTGFYLDQRDARAVVAAYANGAEMLNCFSYTGGFGLAARVAGALSVTQLDSSAEALALAKENEALVHYCGTKMDYLEADCFKQLRLFRDQGRSFDLIVLDPPKFAETKSQLMRAARGYKDLNLLAMKLLRPDGILATFSCSGAMTPDFFDKICREAAFDAHRDFQILARTRQGADHPVSLAFPEGLYLKGLVLRAV